ncbi:UDP-N-acetylmuramoyl-L-alanine--D-glutamate ligase [Vagococcus elongatus]|uniref:UDP-N-acetylmuramoylalanine--D-glutamate ligase n=1 Tax=Vagococcus elongatus TaxID=180344 RepID=A0A430AYB8_9ENTE|nr:UDP-N-acetylmuramoyl-L-alanine--D-glutamate ligase [Vagococcus elongatus]RSU13057.1 UDP-N-acetylmuramoyl-L-alanine--D-glutamate ligase [Vagococcus elongatus]
MKVVKKYDNIKVLVLGLAKSGLSAGKLLHQLGAIVTVNDGKDFDENPEAQQLLALGVKVITGSHPTELLDEDFELVVKNPGIPYDNPMVVKALDKGLPVITEVELAYQISEAPIIGITGTNGKTTTTTMIAQVLNEGRERQFAYLAGNIGKVASQVAQSVTEENVMVTELSSFQLMGIEEFHPQVAVITNLYEAHLDYHKNRGNYISAKWQIQKNMTPSDHLILNFDQKELRDLSKKTRASILPFSRKDTLSNGVYIKHGEIFYQEEKIMNSADLGVPGEHNLENALAAIAVAKLYGVSNAVIKKSLSTFSGVAHRLEYVGIVAGRKVYNDSKATNILATETALHSFENQKNQVILIAGGLDRGNDFESLEKSLAGIKAGVFYGETKNKLMKTAQDVGIQLIEKTDVLDEAVQAAFDFSEPGDIILFSPACASWDQFTNFEIRGDKFKTLIKNLEKE